VFPVRYELNLYVGESRPPLWSSGQISWCRTEMYCVSCDVRTEILYFKKKKVDRLCGLGVRVPGVERRFIVFL
jgi:hypothetical protein